MSEDDLWDNLKYFLERVIPVAAECGVNMAIHEDDPCWSIFGLPRIITCEKNIDRFLGLVDDPHNGITLCTGSLGCSNKNDVVKICLLYTSSKSEFEQRVVAVMLMDHFLVPEYIDRVLAVYNSLKHEGYYCKMGVAWGIATAYAKFPQETHAFLLENELDDFTYNKAIQKMLESYRVSAEDKEMLRGMKRKATNRKNADVYKRQLLHRRPTKLP